MNITNLHELFVHELKDLYSAEKQVLKALPKMVKAAEHQELKKAFQDHLEETKGQLTRIEEIFTALDYSPKGERCEAASGLIEEGEELIQTIDRGPVRDAALIGAAQRFEHYEMAGYGTARTFAEQLGHGSAQRLLQETLDQEAAANDLLNDLAQKLNRKAAHV